MSRNRIGTFVKLLGSAVLGLCLVTSALGGHGKEEATMSIGEGGLAIKGYDTVAYFTDSKATAGKKEFQYTWRDAKWEFTSAEHRAMFIASPEKYAPQFGAFCALGVSMEAAVQVDPEAWTIVDGKLYLNYNLEFRDKWRASKEEKIVKANAVWSPHVLTE
jgi:hypothetical protein